MTVEHLAAASGLSRRFIQRLEEGKGNSALTLEELEWLAGALAVKPALLLDPNLTAQTIREISLSREEIFSEILALPLKEQRYIGMSLHLILQRFDDVSPTLAEEGPAAGSSEP